MRFTVERFTAKHYSTKRIASLLVACITFVQVVTGCASLEPTRSTGKHSALQTIEERWQGRFNAVIESAADQTNVGESSNAGSALTTPKRESVTGRFELKLTEERVINRPLPSKHIVLELSSPLGQLLARLSIEPGKARLETADRGDFSATDMDSLTDRVLGWRVPVEQMSFWLQGQATENSVLDAQRRLVSAVDGGWSLNIDEHNANGKPSKLTLTNSVANQPVSGINKVRLRLLLD
jgi:outer membrane lipoprotein LolB